MLVGALFCGSHISPGAEPTPGCPINEENFKPEFMEAFCESALKMGEKKTQEIKDRRAKLKCVEGLKPSFHAGGTLTSSFLWDTAFCTMWARHAPDRFPITDALDNFYLFQDDDGFICREFQTDGKPYWSKEHPIACNPPILAWAELELFQTKVTGKDRLAKVYPHLKKHHEFCWKTYRRDDGLFFGDALGGGMDDIPRQPKKPYNKEGGIVLEEKHVLADSKGYWHRIKNNPLYSWNKQMGWIDMTAQMAFNALNLSKIAKELGKDGDAAKFKAQHAELAKLINEKCWDEKRGFYFDYYDGETIPRYHAGSFWVMIAEVVPQERVKRFVSVLKDPAIFNRPVPFPALAACEPEYEPGGGYWKGTVWPPTTYMAIRGLMKVGEKEFAKDVARRYYNANAQRWRKTGTFFENISPEQCEHGTRTGGKDFCGWGALAPVAIYKEILLKD